MSAMRYRTSSALLLALLALGCSHHDPNEPKKETYSLSVRNQSDFGVTLNLVKDAPQSEDAWASPEDLDTDRVRMTPNTKLGVVDNLPPGKTATIDEVTGTFPPGVHAFLRVYKGTSIHLKEMLVIKPGDMRQDVPLHPGKNRFVVTSSDGKIIVTAIP